VEGLGTHEEGDLDQVENLCERTLLHLDEGAYQAWSRYLRRFGRRAWAWCLESIGRMSVLPASNTDNGDPSAVA
jgi:hypothetical protein